MERWRDEKMQTILVECQMQVCYMSNPQKNKIDGVFSRD